MAKETWNVAPSGPYVFGCSFCQDDLLTVSHKLAPGLNEIIAGCIFVITWPALANINLCVHIIL